MQFFFKLVFITFICGSVLFAAPAKDAVVNEVLFSIGTESFTSRDLAIYKAVLHEIFGKTKISQFTKKASDDFLLSRLSYNEAKAFELSSDKSKISEAARRRLNDYSPEEINREYEVISVALALIDIKESQLNSQTRFETWFELLKRKYQLKLKSAEVK